MQKKKRTNDKTTMAARKVVVLKVKDEKVVNMYFSENINKKKILKKKQS